MYKAVAAPVTPATSAAMCACAWEPAPLPAIQGRARVKINVLRSLRTPPIAAAVAPSATRPSTRRACVSRANAISCALARIWRAARCASISHPTRTTAARVDNTVRARAARAAAVSTVSAAPRAARGRPLAMGSVSTRSRTRKIVVRAPRHVTRAWFAPPENARASARRICKIARALARIWPTLPAIAAVAATLARCLHTARPLARRAPAAVCATPGSKPAVQPASTPRRTRIIAAAAVKPATRPPMAAPRAPPASAASCVTSATRSAMARASRPLLTRATAGRAASSVGRTKCAARATALRTAAPAPKTAAVPASTWRPMPPIAATAAPSAPTSTTGNRCVARACAGSPVTRASAIAPARASSSTRTRKTAALAGTFARSRVTARRCASQASVKTSATLA